MCVETVAPAAGNGFNLGVVGLTTERFRKVTPDAAQLSQLQVVKATSDFAGDGALIRLGIQTDALGELLRDSTDYLLPLIATRTRPPLPTSACSSRCSTRTCAPAPLPSKKP